jgi:4-diphosphocytidyl-2-C-methyl-D-erythritol kinase
LGLHIIEKRKDGYHDLETCFYPVPWTDMLEVVQADEFSFTSSGTPIPGSQRDNLCIKAFELLRKDFNLSPVKIHLHKIIPTGAGLGGGSSDGANTLRLVNTIFDLRLSTEKLMAYGAFLGSDCSFFVQDKPMVGTGRGEILTEFPDMLRGKYLVMVKPDIHVSTAEAYSGIHPRKPLHAITSVLQQPVSTWKSLLKNDFEETVFERYPVIQEIKTKMYSLGADYASMSGTGSTVFGIFEKENDQLSQFHHVTRWAGVLE